jgi:hypothetical protein
MLQSEMGGSGMGDNCEANPQDDEIILCVRYATIIGWLIAIGLMVFGFASGLAAYVLVLRGDYVRALFGVPACIGFLAVAIDVSFTKHLRFHRQRLVKEWYFLGQRTIPYARAKLCVKPRSLVWMGGPTKAFNVKEIDDTGRIRLMQIPILYCRRCVPLETRIKVEAIACHLVGAKAGPALYEQSRILVQSTLPKEILCQD